MIRYALLLFSLVSILLFPVSVFGDPVPHILIKNITSSQTYPFWITHNDTSDVFIIDAEGEIILQQLTDGNILIGNDTNKAESRNPSGDIDISNTGVFSINPFTIVSGDIADDQITYAKIQNVISDDVFLGRISGANGDTEELTNIQATSLLDLFTNLLKGLVPASGGGTTNFLRADGSWSSPLIVNNEGSLISDSRSIINFNDTSKINTNVQDSSATNSANITLTIVPLSIEDGDLAGSISTTKLDEGSQFVQEDQANTYTGAGTQDFGGSILDNVARIQDNTGAEATSGFLNVANGINGMCWEQSPSGADICIQVDSNDDFVFDADTNNINLNSNPLTNTLLDADGSGNMITNIENADIKAGANIDTTKLADSSNFVLKNIAQTYDDGVKLIFNPSGINAGINVGGNPSAPSSAIDGDLYYDTTDFNLYARLNGIWTDLSVIVLDIISEGDSNVEVIDLGTGQVNVDVDGTNRVSVTSSVLNLNQMGINGYDVETITTTNTLGTDNEIILINPSTTAYTITLPDATGNTGKQYQFIMVSTTGQPITLDGDGSDTIGGRTSQVVEYYNEMMKIVSDGTNWQILEWNTLNNYNYVELIDEFSTFDNQEDDQTTGSLGWNFNIDGAIGNVQSGSEAEPERVGILKLTTGAGNNDDGAIHLGGKITSVKFMDSDESNWSQTMVINVPTLTSITVRLGIAQVINADLFESSDNAFFKFDPSVSANWQCITFGSASQTTTTSVPVVAGTYYKEKIVKDAGTIRFYLDNVNVCNHSTQIPSDTVNPIMQVETNSGTPVTMNIDYFRFSVNLER